MEIFISLSGMKEIEPCHKPCSMGDMQIFIIFDTISKNKKKITFQMQIFYLICGVFSSQMACNIGKKNLSRSHSKSSLHGYLPVLVRLMHHGNLSVAIVGVLWRKHGASASPRLAGISRRPNVWWPKAEQKNSLFGFDLDHKHEPPRQLQSFHKEACRILSVGQLVAHLSIILRNQGEEKRFLQNLR